MIFKLLVALVVLAPLPFASVYPWSTSLMAVAVGVLLAAWRFELIIKGSAPALGLRSTWPFVLLLTVAAGWAVLQVLPFMPGEWHNPIWRRAAEILGVPLAGAVSLNPEATATALMRLLTYAGVFWLALQYCRQPANAHRVFKVLTFAGMGYALYGLWVAFSGSRTILWFDKFAYFDDLTSTFVNRNSYATYAGLGLVCATGLIIRHLIHSLVKPYGRRERLRQIIETMSERGWLLLIAWIAIMTALLMSHSRAGFLSTALALVVLSLLLGFMEGVKLRYVMVIFGFSVLVIGLFFLFSGEALNVRFGKLLSASSSRPIVYRLVFDALMNEPWRGTGYGTFAEAFQSLNTPGLYRPYLKAHNTYLENAFELGLPAAIALLGIFAGFLVLTFRGIRSRRQGVIYPCIGFAATVLVALHSMVDFSLQIPAVAVTYSLIMGAACAQSWSSRKSRDPW